MKKSVLFLLASAALLALQGCDNQPTQTTGSAPRKKLHLAFVSNSSSDFWSLVRLGCDQTVSTLQDIKFDFRDPATSTKEAQQEIVNNLIASGVDGIAISPIDSDSQTEFLNDVASKTLLVCADSDAEKSKRACYIGTDNVAAGKQAAELLKAALPQGGKIVLLVGYPNAQNTVDRVQGIKSSLAGLNIEIVDTLSDDHKSPLAYQNAQAALTKYPDLAGVVGIYGYHGPAIVAAVRGAGKAGKIKIVCFDEYSDTLAGIADGDIYGTVVQKPLTIGRDAILRMDKYLRGDKSQLGGTKILLLSRTVSKDNVEIFQATLKSLLSGKAVEE